MSFLSVTPSSLPGIVAASRRARPPALKTPLIDAPHTHNALTSATATWARAANDHAQARERHFSEAARFLLAVTGADDHLAGRLQ